MDAARKPRILLIDDDRFVRRLAEVSLRQIGRMEVASAASGLEGIRMIEQSVPDLVLLDAVMPVMSGAETLSVIRRSKAYSDVPVVYLTAGTEDTDRYAHGGVLGIIRKPFSPLSLTGTVQRVLENLVPDLVRGEPRPPILQHAQALSA